MCRLERSGSSGGYVLNPKALPLFEEWLKAISTLDSENAGWELDDSFRLMPARTKSNYLYRLLTNSRELLTSISPERVTRLIWYINSHDSGCWTDATSVGIPEERQASIVRSLKGLYLDYFESACDGGGLRPAIDLDSFDGLDGAVYMFWDMGIIECSAFPGGEPHLVDPIFEVLETALSCKTLACQISGLHGLGHLHWHHGARASSLVDKFIANGQARLPWLMEYAQQARVGRVQ